MSRENKSVRGQGFKSKNFVSSSEDFEYEIVEKTIGLEDGTIINFPVKVYKTLDKHIGSGRITPKFADFHIS